MLVSRGNGCQKDYRKRRIWSLEIEVGSFETELGAVRAKQNIGENGNRVAALDHAMHVAQRLQQFRTLDSDLHCRDSYDPAD
jgi:hypothetical protein